MRVASAGFIRSLYYPRPYDNNVSCEWVISVPTGNIISISVRDLRLEDSDSCKYDYLSIRDGNSSSATQLARLCGKKRPRMTFTSSRNVLYVAFVSDSSVTGRGFELYYTSG